MAYCPRASVTAVPAVAVAVLLDDPDGHARQRLARGRIPHHAGEPPHRLDGDGDAARALLPRPCHRGGARRDAAPTRFGVRDRERPVGSGARTRPSVDPDRRPGDAAVRLPVRHLPLDPRPPGERRASPPTSGRARRRAARSRDGRRRGWSPSDRDRAPRRRRRRRCGRSTPPTADRRRPPSTPCVAAATGRPSAVTTPRRAAAGLSVTTAVSPCKTVAKAGAKPSARAPTRHHGSGGVEPEGAVGGGLDRDQRAPLLAGGEAFRAGVGGLDGVGGHRGARHRLAVGDHAAGDGRRRGRRRRPGARRRGTP